MSPRRTPTRHDETALVFLEAGAQLIDAALVAERRSTKFPVALDWLSVGDVIVRAREDHPGKISKGSFFRRWHERDEFVRDAVVYALLYRDGEPDPSDEADVLPEFGGESLSERVVELADGVLNYLANHPRSYLLLHIGPQLTQHEEIWRAVLPEMRASIERWAAGYAALQEKLEVNMRPGWTSQRYALALQAMMDGFLLRRRIQPDDYPATPWRDASLFADTVIAFTVGVLDTGDGKTTHRLLDRIAGQDP